jgi:hypothetical protein
MGRSAIAVVLGVAALAAVPACKKKPADEAAATAVTGLAAVPADAEVLISFDVVRLADSQLVQRGVELVLRGNPTLAGQWSRLAQACQIDARNQIRRVLLALAPATKEGVAQPGLMVISGELKEATLATCVKTAVGTGGGDVAAKTTRGRTIYTVTEGNRIVFFGFGQADTVVLSSNAAWLEAALGPGPKLADTGALKPLVGRADQAAPLWAAGLPGAAITAPLVKSTAGAMKKGPQALFLSVDPSTGLRVELGVDFATEDDAKVLEQFANAQLPTLAMFAQIKSLGPLVAKVAATRAGTSVTIGLSASMAEVNQLLQAIDSPPENPQDSAPSVDAGSAAPQAGSGSGSDAPK